ncbi:MAG: glycosyltransferase [Ferruginibacter sp.]
MKPKKKILLLSTGDVNGAYEAIYRIALILRNDGHEVAMAVKTKTRTDSFIYRVPYGKGFLSSITSRVLEKLRPQKKTDPKYIFLDEDETGNYCNVQHILSTIPFVPDLVLSGMTDGFVVTRHLAAIHKLTGADIYSITVDMSVLTGGCHFAWDCKGYLADCANCPAMLNEKDKDYPRKNLLLKKQHRAEGNIKVIAGSGWTLMQARQSALYGSQEVIENVVGCIDTAIFNPRNREIAKRVFNIEDNIQLIFCGAQTFKDPRKGFSHFIEALKILYNDLDEQQRKNVRVLVVDGADTSDVNIPFRALDIAYIKDYRLLSLAYQAADIFVCSSIEDSGPMTVSEALACGTPVVGFEMGAVSDMVVSNYNGYKAVLKDDKDLAKGMKQILMLSQEEKNKYAANAVEHVNKYASYQAVTTILNRL